jgi:hypothetical protein
MTTAPVSWTLRACAALLLPALLGACSSSSPRFTDGPAVSQIDDNRDIPEPKAQEFWRFAHHIDNFGSRQIRLGLDPVPAAPAEDVNRFGMVPNSSWYENRTATLDPDAVGDGPMENDPGPEAYLPWTITGMKIGGANPGFVFQDTRGERYICKFDKHGAPLIATAAGAVAARLLWACGYNVPDDRVVIFERSDLRIGENATLKTPAGKKVPILDKHIDRVLASVPSRRPDGSYRALASRFLSGRPLGGYSYRGTRGDDPNDTVPHQNRRSLRALRVFGAWLNHVDLKIDNTLDLYTEENGRHYIRHYLVDFDGCLGGYWAARHESRIGHAYDLDLGELVTGTLSAGLHIRPYERLGEPIHPEIGLFESQVYDPAQWTPNYANDQLSTCMPADAFWAGLVMGHLTEAHIRAAVGAARFNDPDATELLTRILRERWEKTVDWALTRVTPAVDLDRVEKDADGITIDAHDALVQLDRPSHLTYGARVLDRDGGTLHRTADSGSPRVTFPDDAVAGRDYIIVEWTANDDAAGRTLPPTQGHYRVHDGRWRLVGILRDGQ